MDFADARGNFKMEAAVMTQPGHSDDTVSIALGHGRQMCGRVGTDVGSNANLIRTKVMADVFRAGICNGGDGQARDAGDYAGTRHWR